jgi:hypothetical protein
VTRQADPEGRAFPEPGFAGNQAAVVLDDPQGDGQAEARALAHLLGGEERVEDAPLDLGRHPAAVVDDLELDIRPSGGPRPDLDAAVAGLAVRVKDRVPGVGEQVDEDLLEPELVVADPIIRPKGPIGTSIANAVKWSVSCRPL